MKTNIMKMHCLIFFCCILAIRVLGQGQIPVPEKLVTENIPELPASYVADVKAYTEARSASLAAWHPLRKEMIISTRFANNNQLHYVRMPGGDRKQLTFLDEPITSASFDPKAGAFFVFSKDKGGDEFSQLYRYDIAGKKITLLTDGGRSQNGGIEWNNKGDVFAYTSTRRNGKDRDIYLINPTDKSSDKKIVENEGGGWSVAAWTADDSQLLLREGISANESRIYLANISTGAKTRILPEKDERTTFSAIAFTADGKGFYLITNKENEFNRLAHYDLASKKITYISTPIAWDVESAEVSEDGKKLAFVTNENGLSRLYILDTSTNQYKPATVPPGVIGNLRWSHDSKSVGFSFSTYNSSADVYEFNTVGDQLTRWTESELGMMDPSTLSEPKLITWKSFDQKTITGYLYPAASKFSGKRPVIIVIHGGPEGQFRPTFIGRANYYLNELGISVIYPNVRGSTGFGKTFLDMDNGTKREESVKDIGALMDWVATQPGLDADRIMVTGGSYGGYMTLAVSYMFSNKIRCAVDIVGISNFNTFMKNTEAYRRDLRRVEYGDERDPKMAEFFEKIAPLNNTDKIKKPLFIVQGGNDPRVPYTEAMQMKEKIAGGGGRVWFLMAKDEGHGFRKKVNQDYEFYSTIAFIRQFLLDDQGNGMKSGGGQ
jgi:dipeptidyl aminopeptidase/acylaminoacyl peptidase